MSSWGMLWGLPGVREFVEVSGRSEMGFGG